MPENESVKMLFNLVEWLRVQLTPQDGSVGMGLLYIGGVLVCIAVGYLLGSLNPAVLVARLGFHEDIRATGHGNADAPEMYEAYGKGAALATSSLRLLQGVAASLLGALIWEMNGLALGGLFAMLGAMFPCFDRFRGGRGAEVMAGMILTVSVFTTRIPVVFLLLLLIFLIVIIGTRFLSLGVIMVGVFYPLILRGFSGEQAGLCLACAVFTTLFIVARHWDCMQRIWNRKEPQLHFPWTKDRNE